MADYEFRQSTREPSHLGHTDPEDGDAINRSLTGGSHFSHASHATASTKSWVQSTQQNPPLPPLVDPYIATSPIRPPRPLPDPQLHPQRFHATNPTEVIEDEEDEEYMNIDPNVPGVEFGYLHGLGKSHKLDAFASSESYTDSGGGGGKSFVGGFFRGIKRLPQKMLRSKGSGEKRGFFRRRAWGTEGSDSVTGMTTGNTLPRYESNAPTPIAGLPNVKFVQGMDMPMPMAPSTEVLAPSFTPGGPIPRARHPSFRVIPPSESIANEESAQLYKDEPQPYGSRPEVYDDQPQRYDSRPQVYEDRPLEPSNFVEEDDSTVRPPGTGRIPTVMMYQDSQDPHYNDPPPPPMVVQAHSPARSPAHTPARSSAHTPARSPARTPSRTPAHSPTRTPSRSPATQPLPLNLIPSRRQTVQTQDTDPNVLSSPSVVSGHPLPARDYRAMTSRSPTSRNTVMTTATSYYDPSFSDLNPVERFFKTLYNLPWVAHERVTIDYRPGDSRNKRDGRYRGKKPMSSWYRGVMSKRRGTPELDLLSNGSASMRTSGTTNMTLGSPISPVSGRSSKRTSDRHRHRDHKKSHRRRKPRRPTSTSTEGETHHPRSTSPIIPTTYPYQYATYPYAYPAYMPPPPPLPAPRSPRGPRSHRQATYPAGYVQYQPMHAPPPPAIGPQPQMYVLQSSPTMTQGSMEAQQGQILQPVYMQVVPGGFSPDTTQSASPPLRPRTPTAKTG